MLKARMLGVVGAGLLSLSLIPGIALATSTVPAKPVVQTKSAHSKKTAEAKPAKQSGKHVSTTGRKSTPAKSSRHQTNNAHSTKHHSKHSTHRAHGTRHTSARQTSQPVHSVKKTPSKTSAAPAKHSAKKPAMQGN